MLRQRAYTAYDDAKRHSLLSALSDLMGVLPQSHYLSDTRCHAGRRAARRVSAGRAAAGRRRGSAAPPVHRPVWPARASGRGRHRSITRPHFYITPLSPLTRLPAWDTPVSSHLQHASHSESEVVSWPLLVSRRLLPPGDISVTGSRSAAFLIVNRGGQSLIPSPQVPRCRFSRRDS